MKVDAKIMGLSSISGKGWMKLIIAFTASVIYSATFSCGGGTENTAVPEHTPEKVPEKVVMDIDPNMDFSKFDHASEQHQRLPCLLCHKREEGSVAIKFSGHTPCAGCHVQQFEDNGNKICTICHTDGGPPAIKGMPVLHSFNTKFDHGKHLGLAACSDCHRSARQGRAFSVPTGLNAHATCFQCHGNETTPKGTDMGSCSTCHVPGSPVRISDRTTAYAVSFSHAKHSRTSCSSCHKVLAGMSRTSQVTAPTALMHKANPGIWSCASCHNGKKAFGADDFANCKRCHVGNSFKF